MFRQMYEEKYMRFQQGRTKAFTLSYDDGVEADKKLVAILDKYGLKGTFNLNSLLWDCENWHGRMDRQTTYETFKGGETYITSLNGCDNFRPATEGLTIWEAFPLNSDQTERINNVKGDISAVYKEYTAAFVTGTKDIDADWQEFLDKLNAAGLEEYLAAYQEAYDVISG